MVTKTELKSEGKTNDLLSAFTIVRSGNLFRVVSFAFDHETLTPNKGVVVYETEDKGEALEKFKLEVVNSNTFDR